MVYSCIPTLSDLVFAFISTLHASQNRITSDSQIGVLVLYYIIGFVYSYISFIPTLSDWYFHIFLHKMIRIFVHSHIIKLMYSGINTIIGFAFSYIHTLSDWCINLILHYSLFYSTYRVVVIIKSATQSSVLPTTNHF